MYTYVCTMCVLRTHENQKRDWIPWYWSYGWYLHFLSHLSSSKIRVRDKTAEDHLGLFLYSISCLVYLKNCLFTQSQRFQTAILLDGASYEMTGVVRGHPFQTCLKHTRRNGKMWFSVEILLQNVHLRTFWTFLCSFLTILERILRISRTFGEWVWSCICMFTCSSECVQVCRCMCLHMHMHIKNRGQYHLS